MAMRYTSQLASQMAKKRQEDTFWLEHDKTEFWYALGDQQMSSMSPEIRAKFVQMYEDDETKEFITESVSQSDSWVLQTWYNLAKAFLSMFSYTQTDMNAMLQRGSMFVLSSEQFEMLLNHGGVSTQELSTRRDTATLIDLGAGDGRVTEKMRPFFARLFATEVSRPMQKLLASKSINVLPIESWAEQEPQPHYDLISCLNLLDRCDNPIDIIETIKKALKPDGLLLLGLVLPFNPFVEIRKSREPKQSLDISGAEFADQVESVVAILQSFGFNLLSWTRVPYLCEGDALHSIYILDDAVFVFKLQEVQPGS